MNADPRPCYNLNLFNLPACPPPLCPVWTHPAPPWCSCCGWERGCSWSTWRRDSLKMQHMPFFSYQTKTMMICQRLFGPGCSWSTWGEIHRHFKRSSDNKDNWSDIDWAKVLLIDLKWDSLTLQKTTSLASRQRRSVLDRLCMGQIDRPKVRTIFALST